MTRVWVWMAMATLSVLDPVSGLSLPSSSDRSGLRADAIAAVANQIVDTKRTYPINGTVYPWYDGPVAAPGSLTQQIQYQEFVKLASFTTPQAKELASLLANSSSTTNLTSMDAIADLYNGAAPIIAKPMAMDNSDETFGQQRLTIKSMAIRLAKLEDIKGKPFALSDSQLTDKCGAGINRLTMWTSNRVFVEDFSNVAQWDDAANPNKYTPNVVGFFCYNAVTEKLLPIEIRFPDTNLAYTPYDTKDEWTLAKMGLEAASIQFHQIQHMAETHAVTIPIRVEMMRHMSAEHPIRALLFHHVYIDFSLEMLVASRLLNTSTGLDQTLAWGASGSVRFIQHQTQTVVSLQNDFLTDVRKRGLNYLPNQKFVRYGTLYWLTIGRFVSDFVNTYYATDADVQADFELQNWAMGCTGVSHLHDFPASFTSREQVRELLTHLIFLSTVRHHAMNGVVTWHSMAVPYSPAALWKALPRTKGETVNLLEYTLPVRLIPVSLDLGALFFRPPPASESLTSAYKTTPFSDEPLLQSAVDTFHTSLGAIDSLIVTTEKSEKWPYEILRPGNLAHYTWV
ncbi:hypothetical protein Poli38472_012439 [Pythium oligandrum]|uniref:Lipoxygenase domain-containing protein n=1 Tax=Pythium oligandrum TaxID=41045 RepID=A0A8K1CQV7_PYTOL|nr:hypothetical protein Poli38472_012439 [Pythium oligandrum]|eukprot:TMW67323.1 hypothetical protein Poli38472_012439 [Pythium oligandrum]